MSTGSPLTSPVLLLQVLIADKLDGDLNKPFIVVMGPLLLALFVLVLLSFSAKGGNKCELDDRLPRPVGGSNGISPSLSLVLSFLPQGGSGSGRTFACSC